jgi:two-component system cell cycle sensor histidine kinase/response regulator CckA
MTGYSKSFCCNAAVRCPNSVHMASSEVFAFVALLLVALYIIVRQVMSSRADIALRETHRFASEIVHNAGEGIVVYDRELRYAVWNRFMEEMTGMHAEDVIGRKATEIFPHLAEQGVDELLRRALTGETVSSPDIHYYVPGTDRQGWVSSVYRPHYDARNNVVGVIALIRDITARKASEQQID